MKTKRLQLAMVLAVMAMLTLSVEISQAEPVNSARRASDAAAQAVREALQREIYGLETDRQQILSSVAEEAPQFGPAHWHQGFVRNGKQGWARHEDYLKSAKLADRLATYERQRAKAADTAEGQLELADWCQKHGLADQERAHLTKVIDLVPEHAAARQRLGFVRAGGGWLSAAEIALEQSQVVARQASLKKWQPELLKLRKALEHKSPERREFARAKLLEIRSADAVPAIEAVYCDSTDDAAVAALDTLARINDPSASVSLARFAVSHVQPQVRDTAAERLGQRDQDSYVPQLLASLTAPVVSQFLAVALPTGRIGYRHTFSREGQNQVDVMTVDTEYQRVARFGGNARETTARAFSQAAAAARQREQQLAIQNQRLSQANDRLARVLKVATGENLPASPEAWWQWWNDRNEVFVQGSKPHSTAYQVARVTVEDYVPPTGSQASVQPAVTRPAGGQRRYDCLAAGTLVWTIKGPQAIETLAVGDLVLSQHPETGELAFKPVLRTTVRPSGQLIKIEAGSETFQTSGGHLFWVAGEGWVKSRELSSGQILHTADGPLRISSVELGIEAETYNLIVADFSTYFVGNGKVLSHDNSVRTPTLALVPGLREE